MTGVVQVQATAEVRLTVLVVLSQPWGDEATIAQVHQQAARQAVEEVRGALDRGRARSITVVGEPVVTHAVGKP